jgi:protein TonB
VAIETRIIPDTPQERPEPPPPPATFEPPPPPFVPPPEIHIATPPPPPAQSTAITTVTPVRPPAPAPAAPPRVPVSVLPHVDAAQSSEPEYPPVSRRLGEQGTVVLEVLVDAAGRAVEATVVQSSGFPRLDEAAVTGVKERYRFAPGTLDGTPRPMRYTFKFTWKLR